MEEYYYYFHFTEVELQQTGKMTSPRLCIESIAKHGLCEISKLQATTITILPNICLLFKNILHSKERSDTNPQGKKINPKAHISNLYITLCLPYNFSQYISEALRVSNISHVLVLFFFFFSPNKLKTKTKPHTEQVSSKAENYLCF